MQNAAMLVTPSDVSGDQHARASFAPPRNGTQVLPAAYQQQCEAKQVRHTQRLATLLLPLFSDTVSTKNVCIFGSKVGKHEFRHSE
jgi:hypothetical protein